MLELITHLPSYRSASAIAPRSIRRTPPFSCRSYFPNRRLAISVPTFLIGPNKRAGEESSATAARDKAASSQAGEFVREEMEHKKRGKQPIKSRKAGVAVGKPSADR